MKYKLPILAVGLLLIWAHHARSQVNKKSEPAKLARLAIPEKEGSSGGLPARPSPATPAQVSQNAPTLRDGSQVAPAATLAESIRLLARQPHASVKLRFRLELWGQTLAGTGIYLQRWSAGKLHYRYDLRFTLGGKARSIQHVADGRFLWIRQNLPGRQTLGRVDLRRLAERYAPATGAGQGRAPSDKAVSPLANIPIELQPFMAAIMLGRGLDTVADFRSRPNHLTAATPPITASSPDNPSPDNPSPDNPSPDNPSPEKTSSISRGKYLGGLLALLDSLDEQFQFEQAESIRWGKARRPVFRLAGNWKNSPTSEEMMQHLPDLAEVIVANSVEYPLFPYRVQLSRKRGDETRKTLLQFDLLQANLKADIPMDRFVFQSGDRAAVQDITFDADALYPWRKGQ